jgi:hypothetical protein
VEASGPLFTRSSTPAAFYTIGDSRFFPATVGLLNSLRLTGHRDPLYILDCGLSPVHRGLLEEHSSVISIDRTRAANPTLFKPILPSVQMSGVVVVMDSDAIVTAPLEPVLREAAAGRIVAVPDPESDRWFAEWQRVFDLSAVPRHQPYVSAGFAAFSVDHWPDLLPRWGDACRRIRFHPTIHEEAVDGPTAQGDQDALNALLMTEVPGEAVSLLPVEAVPVGERERETRVRDLASLSCTHRGTSTLVVQATGRPKPWGRRAWAGVGYGAYLRLLRRCLTGPGLTLRVPERLLAPWLHSGLEGMVRLDALLAFNSVYARVVRVPGVGALARSMQRSARRVAR